MGFSSKHEDREEHHEDQGHSLLEIEEVKGSAKAERLRRKILIRKKIEQNLAMKRLKEELTEYGEDVDEFDWDEVVPKEK